MTELNEYECELLDAVLEAFGIPDSLTRRQLLELFGQDEAAAFAMIQILLREELIAETGKHGDYELPEKLILKPKGEKFLKKGGFTQRHRLEREKPAEVGGTLAKLQQQNMRLQNLKLAAESERDHLQNTISKFRSLQYIWWALILVALIAGYLVGHVHKH
ncbi:MAG: hypothetical protein JWQ66_1629 [Mucilaginibacter sp.]|nr:hypothetical protein [Mucilaginibacter sp.]